MTNKIFFFPDKLNGGLASHIGLFLALAFLLVSCQDNFDITKIEGQPKIVMYCMPTCGDTTVVTLAESVPVNTRPNDSTRPMPLNDAKVSYRLNGVEQQVENLGDGNYRVVVHQQPGDVVRVKAESGSLPTAEAVTVIPEAVEAQIVGMADVRADDNDGDGDFRDYVQLAARFSDDPSTRDYYAVRVMSDYHFFEKDNVYITGDTDGTTGDSGNGITSGEGGMPAPPDGYYESKSQSFTRWEELNIQNEPLLKPLTSADSDFGFERDFYQNFYIFDDTSLRSPSYTLHLNVPKQPTGKWQDFAAYIRYRVVLYKISETAYRFFKSINDMSGNDFASYGFSQITPTPSNVEGGLGMVGAFSTGEGEWKVIDY